MAIVAHLVCIHANHGDLYRTSEVEIVKAQVVCSLLDLQFGKCACIVAYTEENRTSCCHCCIMRNEVEVKDGVALFLNNDLINYCA